MDESHDLEMIRYVPEQHAMHQESLEQERRTPERLQQEWERQERLERELQEQLERERIGQLERERLEQLDRERQEQLEREKLEQLELESIEQLERERHEQQEKERQEQYELKRREQKERLDQASMREAGNRGTQIGLNKLLSNSLYNTPLTSGNNDEGLQNKGNQEPEGALNKALAPRQRNEEDATRLTASSPST